MTKLVKCIKHDFVDQIGKKHGEAKKTAVQKVIDDVMPKMLDALGLATGDVSYAAIEAANVMKIGVHTGYLVSYYKCKNFNNIGWELGSICYDLTQAVRGISSVTVQGRTFDFHEVQDTLQTQQLN